MDKEATGGVRESGGRNSMEHSSGKGDGVGCILSVQNCVMNSQFYEEYSSGND